MKSGKIKDLLKISTPCPTFNVITPGSLVRIDGPGCSSCSALSLAPASSSSSWSSSISRLPVPDDESDFDGSDDDEDAGEDGGSEIGEAEDVKTH